jgi:acylglycerol lipase
LSEAQTNITVPLPACSLGTKARPPVIDWFKVVDGGRIGYRFWNGEPEAPVIVYLHGIEGHSQWFEYTATILNERGMTIYAPDRRGSGMNEQMRGHVRNYKTFLADIEALLRHIRRQHRGNPVFLIANCWSAKLAALLAQIDYKNEDGSLLRPFAGVILTSPAIYTYIDYSFLDKLKIGFYWLCGWQRQTKLWPIPLTTTMLTNNPDYLDYLQKDPLRLTEVTTSFLMQTFFLTLKAKDSGQNIKAPVLILQSGADEIVNIEKSEAWFGKIASTDKSMHIFPEASHSLDFDRVWFKEYTHMLINWIAARTHRP